MRTIHEKFEGLFHCFIVYILFHFITVLVIGGSIGLIGTSCKATKEFKNADITLYANQIDDFKKIDDFKIYQIYLESSVFSNQAIYHPIKLLTIKLTNGFVIHYVTPCTQPNQ